MRGPGSGLIKLAAGLGPELRLRFAGVSPTRVSPPRRRRAGQFLEPEGQVEGRVEIEQARDVADGKIGFA